MHYCIEELYLERVVYFESKVSSTKWAKMGESVQVLENDFVRRIHSKQPSGRLHRGMNN